MLRLNRVATPGPETLTATQTLEQAQAALQAAQASLEQTQARAEQTKAQEAKAKTRIKPLLEAAELCAVRFEEESAAFRQQLEQRAQAMAGYRHAAIVVAGEIQDALAHLIVSDDWTADNVERGKLIRRLMGGPVRISSAEEARGLCYPMIDLEYLAAERATTQPGYVLPADVQAVLEGSDAQPVKDKKA